MSLLEELPSGIAAFLRSSSVGQYVTISAAGMPIDTPVLFFPGDGLHSFNLATGLSYPAKAERARRNPKTALLVEGAPNEPVALIQGMAAVRDADLQGNVLRYLSEAAYTLPHNPDWELARQAVWYWTRMIVEITPARVVWWDSPDAMDGPPQVWEAAPGTAFPPSDPAPPGAISTPAKWDQPAWQELAVQALSRGAKGHLSVVDAKGFPATARVRAIEALNSGFALDLPEGLPWQLAGKACLTFGGIETFLGEMRDPNFLHVERPLPVFPMTIDMTQLWEPAPHTRAELMKRLTHELERRGQPVPSIPLERPEPSEGYRLRMERMRAMAAAKG